MNSISDKQAGMLKLHNVSKTYQGGEVRTTALDRINLEIDAGEYLAITGPSGCGKSTLLSMLGLLDAPDSGDYWFDGQNVAGWSEAQLNQLRRGKVGFIFQSFNLIEELSVAENVELALEYMDVPAKERRERVAAMLDKLGIAHRARHRPSQLSGGQQQRVAIARALVSNPAMLLADEPTGNLDTAHGDEVMRILRQINAEGTTIVMVTHSPEHAAQASRTVRLLDGRILVDALQAA
ncbi:ABC transporter ATP-binding protein [Massilia sp. MAHUQ-52]|uniref:ABC transporter ATP-binding protein n=2 Tax=Telluria group TaxID=2895353 RepID=A0ABS8IR39_9BURK|nr:ABC transporter ATP-binding protein [Massilia agrisoli]